MSEQHPAARKPLRLKPPHRVAYRGQWWDSLIVHVCNSLLHLTTRRYRWTLEAVIRRGMSKEAKSDG